MRRPVLLFVISLALALTLPGADWTLAQQPKRGGVVRIAEREAPGLDPHLSISFLTHSGTTPCSSARGASIPAPCRAA